MNWNEVCRERFGRHPAMSKRLLNITHILPLMNDGNLQGKNKGVFKRARPGRPQPLGRAERMEKYVSTTKRRERRWRHFSTLPL
jgi:hypothetical protein